MPAAIESTDVMQQHLNSPVGQLLMTKLEKRSKFGCCRRYSLVITAFIGIVISSWANSAYLATVGPAPLRFRAPFKPNTNVVVSLLPVPTPIIIPLAVAKQERAPAPALPVPTHDLGPTNDLSDVIVESSRSDAAISPQMLLKYFSKSSNGIGSGVNKPVDFTPPHAAEPPSSKAEYSTPPHLTP